MYVLPSKYKKQTSLIKKGAPVSIYFSNFYKTDAFFKEKVLVQNDQYINQMYAIDNILASATLLIHNNKIPLYLTSFASSFYTKQHPRTAVGVLENGHWVFVVADGRQKQAQGFTILELAGFMKKLGCTGALNLDGGGSSTMVIKNKVINSPSGREYSLVKKERPISNALVITPKQ